MPHNRRAMGLSYDDKVRLSTAFGSYFWVGEKAIFFKKGLALLSRIWEWNFEVWAWVKWVIVLQ